MECGIPQGTDLDSLLFTIHVNNLFNFQDPRFTIGFAGDTLFYCPSFLKDTVEYHFLLVSFPGGGLIVDIKFYLVVVTFTIHYVWGNPIHSAKENKYLGIYVYLKIWHPNEVFNKNRPIYFQIFMQVPDI